MGRWLVQLDGEKIDLAEFPRWFPSGDVFAVEENGTYFLTGPAFEKHSDAAVVREDAAAWLMTFSTVISLLWSAFRVPTAGNVEREDDQGRRNKFMMLEPGELRMRGHSTASFVGAALVEGQEVVAVTGPTEAQEMAAKAQGSGPLSIAVTLWSSGERNWSRLYVILEEIDRHLKPGNVVSAGFCSGKERERFKRTANTAEVAGEDARHGAGLFQPPTDPMDLREATEFIRRVLTLALKAP